MPVYGIDISLNLYLTRFLMTPKPSLCGSLEAPITAIASGEKNVPDIFIIEINSS